MSLAKNGLVVAGKEPKKRQTEKAFLPERPLLDERRAGAYIEYTHNEQGYSACG